MTNIIFQVVVVRVVCLPEKVSNYYLFEVIYFPGLYVRVSLVAVVILLNPQWTQIKYTNIYPDFFPKHFRAQQPKISL